MISKERIIFTPADGGDTIGAYVLAADGTAITHTGGNLNVNVSNLTATDVDIRDLVYTQDSVTAHQGTSPWVVSATDLDIRDLTHASDSVRVGDGTEFLAINADGSINITDNGGSLTVDATDFDIRDLSAAQDSVAAWTHDGTGNAITSSAGALDVNIQSSDIEIDVEDDKANTALQSNAVSVTTTSAALLVSQLADRRFMWVQNHGNKEVYIGASGITTSTGLRLSPGAIGEFRFGPALSLHAVSASGTQDIRLLQAS